MFLIDGETSIADTIAGMFRFGTGAFPIYLDYYHAGWEMQGLGSMAFACSEDKKEAIYEEISGML